MRNDEAGVLLSSARGFLCQQSGRGVGASWPSWRLSSPSDVVCGVRRWWGRGACFGVAEWLLVETTEQQELVLLSRPLSHASTLTTKLAHNPTVTRTHTDHAHHISRRRSRARELESQQQPLRSSSSPFDDARARALSRNTSAMGSLIKSLASLFKGVKRPWQVSVPGAREGERASGRAARRRRRR